MIPGRDGLLRPLLGCSPWGSRIRRLTRVVVIHLILVSESITLFISPFRIAAESQSLSIGRFPCSLEIELEVVLVLNASRIFPIDASFGYHVLISYRCSSTRFT